MRYTQVPFGYLSYYEKIMPEEIIDMLDEDNSMIVGAVDDETAEPYGVIAFTVMEEVFGSRIYMQLNWLFVREDFREREVGSRLFKYMESVYKSLTGIEGLVLDAEKVYESENLIHFLDKRFSKIVKRKGRIYETDLEQIKGSAFIKEILKLKPEGKIYHVSAELMENYLVDLQKLVDNSAGYDAISAEQLMEGIVEEKFNPDISVGYTYEDILSGLILAEKTSDEKIVLKYTGFNKEYGIQAATALIIGYLKLISARFSKKMTIVIESHNEYTDGLLAMAVPNIKITEVYDVKLA